MKISIQKLIAIVLGGIIGLLLVINVISMFYLSSYLQDNIDELRQGVSTSLGRQVHFQKGIDLQWSLRPTIALKDVRIGNAKWASGEHFLAAENAALSFSLLGLLSQQLDISQLTLEKAELNLESSKQGKHNWQFDSGEPSDAAAPASITINDSRLRYRSDTGREHSVTIKRFEIEGLVDRDIDVEADLLYGKLPISISMESDSRVVVETRWEPARSFRFAARIHRSSEFLDLKSIQIRAGNSVLTGEARLPLSGRQGLQLDINSDSLDITPYLDDDEPDATGVGSILDYPVKPESLKGITGQARVAIKQVKAGEILFDDVLLDAKIDTGQMQLTLKDNAGKLNASVEANKVAEVWQVRLRHQTTLDIGELLEAGSDQDSRTQAQAALDINLSGSGKSLKGVLGSTQGKINLKIGAGRLSDAMAELLPMGNVVDSLLTTVATQGDANDHSRLECAVLAMDVKDGVASSKNGLAIRTPTVNVLGGGSVNLVTGQIEFHFKTARRKGIGISVKGVAENFVHLTGTLNEPKTEVNTAGFLVHGGGAWATGGVSLFYDSLVKRLTSAGNPCEVVEKSAK